MCMCEGENGWRRRRVVVAVLMVGGGGGSCVIILKVSQDTGTVSQRLGMKRRRMRKRDGGVSGWWMGVGYRWWWLGRGGGK